MSNQKKTMKELMTETKNYLKSTQVEIPGVGKVTVVEMTSRAHDAYEASLIKINPETEKGEFQRENMRAKLVSCSLVDENGELMFPGEQGVVELGALPKAIISKLYDAAAKLNSMDEDAVEKKAKN